MHVSSSKPGRKRLKGGGVWFRKRKPLAWWWIYLMPVDIILCWMKTIPVVYCSSICILLAVLFIYPDGFIDLIPMMHSTMNSYTQWLRKTLSAAFWFLRVDDLVNWSLHGRWFRMRIDSLLNNWSLFISRSKITIKIKLAWRMCRI